MLGTRVTVGPNTSITVTRIVPGAQRARSNWNSWRLRASGNNAPQQSQETTSASTADGQDASSSQTQQKDDASFKDAEKKVSAFVRSTATTFAPRSSTAVKNPAYKGSALYSVFGAQAWISAVVGGLLSFNILFPTDQPSIARLIGMWSVWMFTIPALRARECTAAEKEALNLLFLLVPLMNVTLPLVWKSFPFIFSADCVAMAAVYMWKVGLPANEQTS